MRGTRRAPTVEPPATGTHARRREAGSLRLRPARVARRRPRGAGGRPGREGAGRRAEPGAVAVDAAGRARRGWSTSTGCPASTRHRGRTPTACASARWPGTPTCWPPTTYAACSRWSRLALANVAHATIRNRGTTVGSIVHADAAAEMPMVLRLLGGSLEVAGPSGRRTIAADDLYVGPLESSLHHDEIAVSAFFPALAPGAGVAFEEIARRHGDYALCGVAALVTGETRPRRLPVGLRGADRRRPHRRRRRRPRRRRARAPRPRRRHPRHRRLPRPAGAGADRAGRGGREEDGRGGAQ